MEESGFDVAPGQAPKVKSESAQRIDNELTAGIKAIEDRNSIGGFATKRSNLLAKL